MLRTVILQCSTWLHRLGACRQAAFILLYLIRDCTALALVARLYLFCSSQYYCHLLAAIWNPLGLSVIFSMKMLCSVKITWCVTPTSHLHFPTHAVTTRWYNTYVSLIFHARLPFQEDLACTITHVAALNSYCPYAGNLTLCSLLVKYFSRLLSSIRPKTDVWWYSFFLSAVGRCSLIALITLYLYSYFRCCSSLFIPVRRQMRSFTFCCYSSLFTCSETDIATEVAALWFSYIWLSSSVLGQMLQPKLLHFDSFLIIHHKIDVATKVAAHLFHSRLFVSLSAAFRRRYWNLMVRYALMKPMRD